MRRVYAAAASTLDKIPYAAIALVARVAAAIPFWRSGQSKLDGGEFFGVRYELFTLKPSKVYLFTEEFGFGEALGPLAAQAAALGENILPPMLVLGVLARMSALGLFVMTAVIQFFVFPGELLNPNGNWSLHLLWAAPLLLILARGPGAISLDAAFRARPASPARPL